MADILKRLPSNAIRAVERSIEGKLRDWASELVTHERWARGRRNLDEAPFHRQLKWRQKQLLGIVREFAGDYAVLLERVVVEYVRELGTLIHRSKIALSEMDRQEVVARSFRFAQRFTLDRYDRPWGGFFMLPPADSREMPDERTFSDFQRVNSLAWLFSEARHRATPELVNEVFSREIDKGAWKDRARGRARDELLLAMTGVQGDRQAKLSDREKKISEIIRRGAKGPQYARELKSSRVMPRRSWVQAGCPSDYVSAYKKGPPWRQRIQNEKSKIAKKSGIFAGCQ
jgi:hypothetical protein